MTSLPATFTTTDVADALGETEAYVKTRCRQRDWPHLRGARGRVSFTAAQYAQILEIRAQAPIEAETGRMSFAPRSRRAS